MSEQKSGTLILYESFYEQFQLLDVEDRGKLITAVFEYAFGNREPTGLSPLLQMAFCPIRYAVDRDRQLYLAKCQKNTENGKKGGRPRKDFFDEKTERFSEETEKPYNKNKNKNKNKSDYMNKNKNNDESVGFPPYEQAKSYDLEEFEKVALQNAAYELGKL